MDGPWVADRNGVFEPIGCLVIWRRFVGTFLTWKSSISGKRRRPIDSRVAKRISNGYTRIRHQWNRSIDGQLLEIFTQWKTNISQTARGPQQSTRSSRQRSAAMQRRIAIDLCHSEKPFLNVGIKWNRVLFVLCFIFLLFDYTIRHLNSSY